jgi:predicted nucleotidyltransferase
VSNANRHVEMLTMVAKTLGPELCQQVAFVGGCTTSLFLTDEFTREQVRHTEDVDVIVSLVGVASFARLQALLRDLGFQDSQDKDDPICAMKLGSLRVDFMPDDEKILGFSNRWYQDAWSSAEDYVLETEVTIRLIKPVYFVATKLEAYLGRGDNDPLGSRDIEDFLNLFDGRPGLLAEIEQSDPKLRKFIAIEIQKLLEDQNFAYAVQACALGDGGREALIFQRLEKAAQD